ncbi:MAG: DUF2085 domain-containing protein [Bacteroidota bacterium]|nr:DUF2085 domain-containing protein [Bacteroidota bacterium]
MKKELNLLIAMVFIWCSVIIATPLMVSYGVFGSVTAHFFYKFFHTICHQFESRSFHINDHPFAVCIRCSSIYAGFFVALLAIRFINKFQKESDSFFHHKRIMKLILIAFPMFIDAMVDTFNIIPSSTLSRIITGGWFGLGMAVVLQSSLTDIIHYIFSLKLFTFYDAKTR